MKISDIPRWLKWTGAISASIPLALLIWTIATGIQSKALAATEHETMIMQTAESIGQITEMVAGDALDKSVEDELQRIELEMKLLNSISERRVLTLDEVDRKQYLVDRKIQLKNRQLDRAKGMALHARDPRQEAWLHKPRYMDNPTKT